MYSSVMPKDTYDLVLREFHAGRFRSITFWPIPKGFEIMLNNEFVQEPYQNDLVDGLESWYYEQGMECGFHFEPGVDDVGLFFTVTSRMDFLMYGSGREDFDAEALGEDVIAALGGAFGELSASDVLLYLEATLDNGAWPDKFRYSLIIFDPQGVEKDISENQAAKEAVMGYLSDLITRTKPEQTNPTYSLILEIEDSNLSTFRMEFVDRLNILVASE